MSGDKQEIRPCKGPKVETCVVSEGQKEASVVGVEQE